LEIKTIILEFPSDANIVLGQSHFIKTVEDLHEIMATTVPTARFGIAFSEASGPCLVRADGNDKELEQLAVKNVLAIGAGHCFLLIMKDAYPINVLPRIRECQEVCGIFCATANPVTVLVAPVGQGRAILGVVDGASPQGVEGEEDVKKRKEFLRTIGYKR
jgi:adenosine/AMP kinase